VRAFSSYLLTALLGISKLLIVLGTQKRNRIAERREAASQEILDAAWAVAREKGLAELTLRDVAERVGMQPPSLYSYFSSKNDICDAMFGQAWLDAERGNAEALAGAPEEPRRRVQHLALCFFDFASADLARHQLMNQRTIPGFEPSPEAFAPSQRTVQASVEALASLGVKDRGDVEILFGLIAGLVDQQLANDPGGTSRRALLERAIEMWADGVGLPAAPAGRRTKGNRR
jgi:AcrR family transcriptional regulator